MTGDLGWSRAVTLTSAEMLVAWQAFELGDPPLDLELEPCWLPGGTPAARRALLDDARERIRRRGVLDGDSRLAATLRLLAAPAWTCDLRIADPGDSWVALGAVAAPAAGRGRAVVAVHRDRRLSLLTVAPVRLVHTVVELVGGLSPGRAHPVNIPAELLDQARRAVAGQGPWALADRLIALGVRRAEARSLARMCDGITAAGQLGVTAHRGGGERRGPWTLALQRTVHGDFAHHRRDGTLSAAPITTDRLEAQLHELVAATVGR